MTIFIIDHRQDNKARRDRLCRRLGGTNDMFAVTAPTSDTPNGTGVGLT